VWALVRRPKFMNCLLHLPSLIALDHASGLARIESVANVARTGIVTPLKSSGLTRAKPLPPRALQGGRATHIETGIANSSEQDALLSPSLGWAASSRDNPPSMSDENSFRPKFRIHNGLGEGLPMLARSRPASGRLLMAVFCRCPALSWCDGLVRSAGRCRISVEGHA
jgi:hypothetical protein